MVKQSCFHWMVTQQWESEVDLSSNYLGYNAEVSETLPSAERPWHWLGRRWPVPRSAGWSRDLYLTPLARLHGGRVSLSPYTNIVITAWRGVILLIRSVNAPPTPWMGYVGPDWCCTTRVRLMTSIQDSFFMNLFSKISIFKFEM